MYRKKANIAFINRKKRIIFSIYTHTSKISPKLIVSLIWSQKLEEGERIKVDRLSEHGRIAPNQQPHADSPVD